MKKNIKNKFLALLLGASFCASAQTNYKGWYNHNRLIDFTGGTPNLKTAFNANPNYNKATNSVYDSEGKLLFYISNTNYGVYNKFGALLNTLGLATGYSYVDLTEIFGNSKC